ncbi:hypothetical protein [Pseudoalteromonas virus vB_PspP-H6/1]|nr:hypothetical protein [Pseudoalteromonas virus vB_PspP-H6/1]
MSISQIELKAVLETQSVQDKLRKKVSLLLRKVGDLSLLGKVVRGERVSYSDYQMVLGYAEQVGKPVPDKVKGKLLNALKYCDDRSFNAFGQELK